MLVITGNPGVGKHTITKKLAEKLGLPVLDLNQIAIQNKVYEKKGNTLDVDVKKLSKIVKKLATRNSIIVGHLAPYVLGKAQIDAAIILRKNPYKLIPIYKKRKYTQKKIIENVGSEILGIIEYDSIVSLGAKKTFQINATNLTPDKVVSKIRMIINRKSRGDKIDWLELVAKKGDLAKFFPNK